MRRTAVAIVGLCVYAALGGMAVAGPRAPGLVAPGAAASGAAAPGAAQITAARAEAADGPQRVGTTERVSRGLDYRSVRPLLTLRYPGSSYVKVHFSRIALAPGDYLTVADAHGRQSARYRGAGARWAMSVDGDTAVLTLHRSAAPSRVDGLGASVDRVAHGFTPVQRSARRRADQARRDAAIRDMRVAEGADARTESVCGTSDSKDAVCYRTSDPVAYQNSRAVARLLINGDELCTGWRVGRNDRLFTNHHCFTSTTEARDTEVWFNYECAVCGRPQVNRPTKVWGDSVLATDATLDYTLFTVQDFPAIAGYGYLTVDVRDPAPAEEVYIPQHPGGDPTTISIASDQDRGGNCQVTNPQADGYAKGTDVSYLCDTAGGSSGSPVISRRTDRVVALHHFGGCPNSGVRMDLIYQAVGRLL